MSNFSEKANFIWSIANLLRDSFKRGKYQDVILPFTVLRRIDSVLAPTKADVRQTWLNVKDEVDNPHDILCQVAGYAFYNTSQFTFETVLSDYARLATNLRSYINGFSPNMREVIEHFDFDNTIKKLEKADLLYIVMEKFNSPRINLHPAATSNLEMGQIFE